MHESTFHYNVTRPYPYRWFTPVVIVAGIIFTLLFSVLNVGASGYYLAPKYTADPNATEADANSVWFIRPPFNWGSSSKPRCEPLMIPVGYEFFTSNLGLRYTVSGIKEMMSDDESKAQVVSSVTYMNNELQDCAVKSIQLDLSKRDSSPAPGMWWSWTATGVMSVSCDVVNAAGRYRLALTTTFKEHSDSTWIVTQNYTSHASLWWGAQLLNLRFLGTKQVMSRVVADPREQTSAYVSGSMFWTAKGSDPQSYDYFNMTYWFLQDNGVMRNIDLKPTQKYNNRSLALSAAMTEGLQFAKTMRSLIEVDVAVKTDQNMFMNDNLLQYAILAPDNMNHQASGALNATTGLDWSHWAGINFPGTILDYNNRTRINEAYSFFKRVMGPLGTQKATVFTQYACSVPVQKGTGSLLLAILLADLVFLQAIWKLYNLIVGMVVCRKDQRANWCLGCLHGRDDSAVDLGCSEGDDRKRSMRDSQTSLIGDAAPIETVRSSPSSPSWERRDWGESTSDVRNIK